MHWKILYILFLTTISCSNNYQSGKILEGNWYTYNPNFQIDLDTDYDEIFFQKDTLYICGEYTGIQVPRKYLISNDSVFFHPKNDLNFIGVILMKSKDSFSIEKNGINKQNFYKIRDSINLENVFNKRISKEIYYVKFYERKVSTIKYLKSEY